MRLLALSVPLAGRLPCRGPRNEPAAELGVLAAVRLAIRRAVTQRIKFLVACYLPNDVEGLPVVHVLLGRHETALRVEDVLAPA